VVNRGLLIVFSFCASADTNKLKNLNLYDKCLIKRPTAVVMCKKVRTFTHAILAALNNF